MAATPTSLAEPPPVMQASTREQLAAVLGQIILLLLTHCSFRIVEKTRPRMLVSRVAPMRNTMGAIQ